MSKQLSFALVGRNIEYSLSPAIFQAIFDHHKVEGQFKLCSVGPEELAGCIRQLINEGSHGFSVTIPYKQRVVEFLDSVGPVAQAVSAVNSVAVKEEAIYGYNTDCYGFSLMLKPYRKQVQKSKALILGNGGAARAVIYALHKDYDTDEFIIAGRSPDKLARLSEELVSSIQGISIRTATFSSGLQKASAGASLVVNCTPLGGSNHADKLPLPEDFSFDSRFLYCDLNYNRDNKVIRAAREAGITAIDGSTMLVGQAVRSFEIWTGHSVPFQPIFDAVFSITSM